MAEMDDHEHDVEFHDTDAGASTTIPVQAGSIRKGGHIVIKGRPCKVVDVSTSKTGKHGHAKCHFVAIDIFTGKKLEELVPSSHNCEAPIVGRVEYSLMDIDDEGFVTLMDEGGNNREDLTLPSGTEDSEKLAKEIRDTFEDDSQERNIAVTVMKAMNEELIIGMKLTD
eukprot:jgi/Tetstr1/438904/TSEL_027412.t1